MEFLIMMKIMINKIIIFQINISLCITTKFQTTLTLTLCEPDYRWIVCSSPCRLQPCTNSTVAKGSFSSQQICCSLWGRNWS